jgi:hypothetical protein
VTVSPITWYSTFICDHGQSREFMFNLDWIWTGWQEHPCDRASSC